MNRRTAISRLTLLSGGALLLSTGLLQSCHFTAGKRTTLTNDDIPLLDEIGDTIIPITATSPGAKATAIGAFLISMVNDCYSTERKGIFIEGLNIFEAACGKEHKAAFIDLSPAQKKAFLQKLDAEAKAAANSKVAGTHPATEHYFGMLKQLVIQGYTTSKIGATQALRYDPVPGIYEGCIDYKKGDKPWATV